MALSGSQIGTGVGTAAGYALSGVLGPLGPVVGSVFGGLLGGLFDEGPDVQALMDQMAKQYEGIVQPNLARAIAYAQYKQGGTLTPQQLNVLPIEAQKAVQLTESPEMRQKQQAQMQQMEQLAQTGMGPQELLALEKSRRAAASDAQARLASLMQQYQQRGMAGSGAELASQLASNQQANDQEAMMNMQASAMAAENRRNAIQQAFSAASGMRQQDLSVNQYNTENLRQKQMFDIQNAMTRQQLNAQYANQANMMNLQRQQQVSDMNLQQYNQELYRQQYLAPQQMYQNQMAMANAKANILGTQAGLAQQQAQAQAQANMNTMMGAAQLGMSMAQYGQNDKLIGLQEAGVNQKQQYLDFITGRAAPVIPTLAQNQNSISPLANQGMAGFGTQYPQMGLGGMQAGMQGGYGIPGVNMGQVSYLHPWMAPQMSYYPQLPHGF